MQPSQRNVKIRWCIDKPSHLRVAGEKWSAGCLLCYNYVNSGKTKRTSKWARFEVQPLNRECFNQHAEHCKLHKLALAFHFECSVSEVVVKKIAGRSVKNPSVGFAQGRPQPEDYIRTMGACWSDLTPAQFCKRSCEERRVQGLPYRRYTRALFAKLKWTLFEVLKRRWLEDLAGC